MIIYEDILRQFQRQKVKYIIVGGIAVNLLGYLRSTADMDILAEMSDENLRKIVSILIKAGYRVKQPVDPLRFSDKATREDWIKNKHLKAFNFYKGLNEVDIIIDTPVSFEQAKKDIVWIKGGDITLPVISIKNLIKMKKKASRGVDKLDVMELNEISKLRKIK